MLGTYIVVSSHSNRKNTIIHKETGPAVEEYVCRQGWVLSSKID